MRICQLDCPQRFVVNCHFEAAIYGAVVESLERLMWAQNCATIAHRLSTGSRALRARRPLSTGA
jgi:hypothetical protein